MGQMGRSHENRYCDDPHVLATHTGQIRINATSSLVYTHPYSFCITHTHTHTHMHSPPPLPDTHPHSSHTVSLFLHKYIHAHVPSSLVVFTPLTIPHNHTYYPPSISLNSSLLNGLSGVVSRKTHRDTSRHIRKR